MFKARHIRGAVYLVSGEDAALSDDMVFTATRFVGYRIRSRLDRSSHKYRKKRGKPTFPTRLIAIHITKEYSQELAYFS